MSSTQVLIVGAGPTGLNLALRLARLGIAVRLIDRAAGPGTASRAMAVHARTLELYRQLGLADEIVAQGIPATAMHLREGDAEITKISFENIGADLSPFPFVLSYPQDDHERFLVAKLEGMGVHIEWGVALTHLSQHADGVHATLSRGDSEETCEAVYLCGCDGGHSKVRSDLGLEYPGGDYPQRFYVVDAKLVGDFTTDAFMNLGEETFALKLPVRSRGMQRLIGLVPTELADRADLTFEDIRASVEHLLAVKVETVNWFSAYYAHHRVAPHFRVGRCFLAGDAAHIHSPAGGQGMNTGIGDAANLAWKLASVLHARADPSILDTYETERIAFARKLVATTDTAFRVPIRGGFSGRLLRSYILPHAMPALFQSEQFRRFLFKTVSQTRITYRATSALSQGRAGKVHSGDRLPWVASGGADNFAPLATLDWQLHVYGIATRSLHHVAQTIGLQLHAFVWGDGAARAGFARDAAYLVRPDGHLGLVLLNQDSGALRAYVDRFGLKFAA